MRQKLQEFLDYHTNSPFLFIGSGFSRRYIGLEAWPDLLKLFSKHLADFNYYYSRSGEDLPYCAELIADDYSEYWWKSIEKENSRNEFKHLAVGPSSPLKIDISEYLRSKTINSVKDAELKEELEILKELNIHGFITTNWDFLLEELFPQYKVFIGQRSILTGNPQNIGEIFKIHGCCSEPNSLILTKKDYDFFQQKSAYLAAKLITIFVEHPVIFIGYSISDPNIISLLRSIIEGLSQSEIDRLQRNLIFIQRRGLNRSEGIQSNIIVVNNTQIPVTQIVTDDFKSIYEAIRETKLKLPARVLRFCQEQIYNIVSSKNPSEKLALVDIEDIEDHSEIEFVVGIGVIKTTLADVGYFGVTAKQLFHDLLLDNSQLEADRVVKELLPHMSAGKCRLPVFKYLQGCNVKTKSEALKLCSSFSRLIETTSTTYQTPQYKRQFEREWAGRSTTKIIAGSTKEKAAIFLTFQNKTEVEIDILKQFLIDNFDALFSGSYSSFFRKTLCFYDFIKYKPW